MERKIVFVLSVFLLLVLSACQDDVEYIIEQNSVDDSISEQECAQSQSDIETLVVSLRQINKPYIERFDSMDLASTRIFGRFSDFLSYAGPDALAALEVYSKLAPLGTTPVTAVVVAAVGAGIAVGVSEATYRGLTRSMIGYMPVEDTFYAGLSYAAQGYPSLIDNGLNCLYPEGYSDMRNVGLLHNQTLRDYYSGKIHMSSFSVLNPDVAELKKMFYNKNEYRELYYETLNCFDYRLTGKMLTRTVGKMQDKGLITSNMALVMIEYIKGYYSTTNISDVKKLTDEYITSIWASPALELKEKEAFLSSFSIAIKSPYFWAEKMGSPIF